MVQKIIIVPGDYKHMNGSKKNKDTPEQATNTPAGLKSSLDFAQTRIDHLAVWITDIFGSMTFLVGCILFFILWISWNLHFIFFLKPFDPFPFNILQMVVSIFAIILSVSVLINQNRQGRIEKIRQQVEFEVNVLAENEITKVLGMLHEIHQHLGLNSKEDKELERMKEVTDINQIHLTLNDLKANPSSPDET
jgi:uncharacterized membrane protein